MPSIGTEKKDSSFSVYGENNSIENTLSKILDEVAKSDFIPNERAIKRTDLLLKVD